MLRRLLLSLLLLLLVATATLNWLLSRHPQLEPYEDLFWPAVEAQSEPTVRFLGTSTVLLDDGETALLTDGFFSRPGKFKTLLGKIAPDQDAITRGLQSAAIRGKLAAVIVVHSHYDHAMDAPEVARRTGALLIGSESTLNVGRGAGLASSQMQLAVLGQSQRYGKFTVTIYPGRHAPTGITGGEITEPLTSPARISDYKEGASYIVHVAHEGRTLLIAGSAGFEPGALQGVKADVVMMGIGNLGMQSEEYREQLWRELVVNTGARRVIPIHWDDFFLPFGQPWQPLPWPLDNFKGSMSFLRERAVRDNVALRLPAQEQPMDLWKGLR